MDACKNCLYEYKAAPECEPCIMDEGPAAYQKAWINSKSVTFMGVNIAPAFEHPARVLALQEKIIEAQAAIRPES